MAVHFLNSQTIDYLFRVSVTEFGDMYLLNISAWFSNIPETVGKQIYVYQ